MKATDLQISHYTKVHQRRRRLRVLQWRLRKIHCLQTRKQLTQFSFVLRFANHDFSCLQLITKSIPARLMELTGSATKGDRDVYNEKPTRDDRVAAEEMKPTQTGTEAVMHTTLGDIFIKL